MNIRIRKLSNTLLRPQINKQHIKLEGDEREL